MVEVPNFQSLEATILLRTKINDTLYVIETTTRIEQPDDFLSNILELDITFEFPPQSIDGCIEPQFANYDCSARINDGMY